MSEKTNLTIIIEESHEPPSLSGGKIETMITTKGIDCVEGNETYFGSGLKEEYKSDSKSPLEIHNEGEYKPT